VAIRPTTVTQTATQMVAVITDHLEAMEEVVVVVMEEVATKCQTWVPV